MTSSRGALTSCNQVTGSLVARDLGITLGAWSFRIQGDLDTAVLVGGADGLLASVLDTLQRWSGGREQGDDITLMALVPGDG